MSVIVTFGVEPILGTLPDLVFQAGDTLFNAIHLNKYVFDDDTPDDSLSWTFMSIKQVTNANEAKLARGRSHTLDIWADPGFVGPDVVVLTAEDPEGNSISDTINVSVTSSSSLYLDVIPSPVSLNFIDIIVIASDSLLGAPSLSITFNDVSEDIDANKIPDALIWKGDYFFKDGVTGEATIIAVAADLFGGEIRDSIIVYISTTTIFGSFAFKDENVELNIPQGFLDGNERIMVMRDESRNFRKIFQQNDAFPERLGLPVLSYFFGPSEISGLGMSELDFDLTGIGLKEGLLEKYGVYYLNEAEGKTEYIPVAGRNNILNKSSKINKLGRYFIAPDFSAPDIKSVELVDPGTLTFNVKVFEEESGVAEVFTFIEDDEFKNRVEFTDDGLEVRIRDFKQSGDFVLNLSITDRAGNQSYAKERRFKLDKPPLPERYELKYNYPNPFNSSTMIQFQLPTEEHVSLEIFNIRGQEIIRLVDKKMSAGYYTVSWDGRNSSGVEVSTGVYIYRLRTKSFTRAMKMVVLR
jgi:hypothetical protein